MSSTCVCRDVFARMLRARRRLDDGWSGLQAMNANVLFTFVNDGSTDKTLMVLEQMASQRPNRCVIIVCAVLSVLVS